MRTTEYISWLNAKQRCTNPNASGYKNYAARGIDMCDEWLNSFERFLSDMGKKPSKEHTLERIDNNKGYSPSNCKWATRKEQAANRRQPVTNTSGYTGVTWDKERNMWRAKAKVNGKTVYLGNYTGKLDASKAYQSFMRDV